jgi:6-phosphogluconolactonase
VDWSRVEVWWGDERFVPSSDDERNAVQAFEDLLSRVPVDPDRVHVAPATGVGEGAAADVESAAAAYEHELGEAYAHRRPDEPCFDVLMLGIGPDGHCASLFPGHEQVRADGLVVPVRDSPKPPPERVSFSMALLHRARQVWFVASGTEKADAVRRSVAGGDIDETPAAGPRGLESTTWFLDRAAASAL